MWPGHFFRCSTVHNLEERPGIVPTRHRTTWWALIPCFLNSRRRGRVPYSYTWSYESCCSRHKHFPFSKFAVEKRPEIGKEECWMRLQGMEECYTGFRREKSFQTNVIGFVSDLCVSTPRLIRIYTWDWDISTTMASGCRHIPPLQTASR